MRRFQLKPALASLLAAGTLWLRAASQRSKCLHSSALILACKALSWRSGLSWSWSLELELEFVLELEFGLKLGH